MCGRTGALSVEQFLDDAGRNRIDTTVFAPLVFEAAGLGDEAACEILRGAGTALGETAAHVIRQLEMQDSEFDLVLAGGLFRAPGPFLRESVERTVQAAAPAASIVALAHPPVIGASLLAIDLAGAAPDHEVRERLGASAHERIVRRA